jgi:AraC-like DNA-binding protein
MNYHPSFFSLHDTILILTALESFILCLLLKIIPNKNNQSRNLLISFFFFTGGIISTTFIIWNSHLQTLPIANSTLPTVILAVSTLLQGPALYFYFRSLSERINLFEWINFIHFLPATITSFIIILFDVSASAWLPWNKQNLLPDTRDAVNFAWAILRCLPISYVAACVFSEYRFRLNAKDNKEVAAEKYFLANLVLGGFVLIEIWSIAGYFLGAYISGEASSLMGMTADYLSTFLVNAMFVYGLATTRKILHNSPTLEKKPAEPTITIDPEKIFAIEKGIREDKLHLVPNLNLDRFSNLIGLKPRDVTGILNTYYHQNFFDFINAHRLKEALYLLSSEEFQNLRIIDVIDKSGFNSESTFARYFKKATGFTPRDFREQQLKNTRID